LRGRDLFEQLQPFRADAVFEQDEAGGVAIRPRQAGDEAVADRINNANEDDRYRAGRLVQRPHQAVAAMLLGNAAERPQRILQALGQRDETLAAEHNMGVLETRASRKW